MTTRCTTRTKTTVWDFSEEEITAILLDIIDEDEGKVPPGAPTLYCRDYYRDPRPRPDWLSLTITEKAASSS